MPELVREYRFTSEYCMPFQSSKMAYMVFMESPSGKLVPHLVKTEEEATSFTSESEVQKVLAEVCLHPTIFKVQGAMDVRLTVEERVGNTTSYFAHLTLRPDCDEALGCMVPLN